MSAILAQVAPPPPAAARLVPPRRPLALRAAAPSPRRRTAALVVRADVGKYLGEAAAGIFNPQANDVPWEKSSTTFSGKIVHHEEAARVRALEVAVDAAVTDLRKSMDEAPEGGEEPKGSELGEYVLSSIKRVFGNNFKGDATEPKEWISGGYQGRARSQRALRQEYDRLTRFQTVVKKVAEEMQPVNKDL